ncbi:MULTISPECIES: hypothetical protein [Hyphomicrobiales]|uniref:hypothetical protein n=1 Tax=Hyphomicrobiales TaxID=356 RepID=UPI001951F7A3|nr:hypothetical protein [Brucella anthropi]MBM6395301.1 hypothetical protein [Brucella anthropi]
MRMWNPFLLSLILILLSVGAFAQSVANERKAPWVKSGAPLEIVEDQESAAFRFIIDGREVARLDNAGLYVDGSIEYGGTLTDTGSRDAGQSKTENAP